MRHNSAQIASILTLTPNRTQSRVSCSSKKRILELLAETIASSEPDIDADELFQQFIVRERLGSTGIGEGIAIPHCRCKRNDAMIGALITLAQPIDFDSVDSKPVDIVCALLVPEKEDDQHLQTLSKLAEALQQQNYVKELRNASSDDQLFRVARGDLVQ